MVSCPLCGADITDRWFHVTVYFDDGRVTKAEANCPECGRTVDLDGD